MEKMLKESEGEERPIANESETLYNGSMKKMDYMAQQQFFKSIDKSGNAIFVRAKKQYRTSFDIWAEDTTKKSRHTLELLESGLQNYAPKDMPTFVVAVGKKLKGGLAAYDYKTDVMYISNRLMNRGNVKKLLSNGYFASKDFDDLLKHELTHKKHWDRAKALYKANPKKYNSIEEAKKALDEELVAYVKRQKQHDYNYVLNTVSENAHIAFSIDNINELVADVMIRGANINDETLLQLVKGVLR